MKQGVLFTILGIIAMVYLFSGFCEVGIAAIFSFSFFILFFILTCVCLFPVKLKFPILKKIWMFGSIVAIICVNYIFWTSPFGEVRIRMFDEDLSIEVVALDDYDNNYYVKFLDANICYDKTKKYPIDTQTSIIGNSRNYFNINRNKISPENPLRFQVLKENKIIFTGIVKKTKRGYLIPTMYYNFF